MSAIARLFEQAPVAQVERARAEAQAYTDYERWWAACPRGDWMLWAAGRAGVDLRLLVAAGLDCARMALVLLDDEESREIAAEALAVGDLWCDGRVGPLDCRRQANRVYREAERTVPIANPRLASARTSALGAVEAAVQAAGWSDDRQRCAEFAAKAARSVAVCWERMDGPDEQERAHAACADRVRARISAKHLTAGGPTP